MTLEVLKAKESGRMSLPNKRQKIDESSDSAHSFVESEKLLTIEYELCDELEKIKFNSPVEYVYNPLKYAKDLNEAFTRKYFENSTKKILFLGMNPGPWGMCQTGIFFGEINYVVNWLEISGTVEKPVKEHPKKKVLGLSCHRSEGSGKKFWNLFKDLCGTPENFFKYSFVYNLCPLAFTDGSGKNITPPEIKDKETRKKLNEVCYKALIKIIKEFNFEIIIGIGNFARDKAQEALNLHGITNVKVYLIPHPSPRNAKVSSKWEENTKEILEERKLINYFTKEK